MAKEGKDVVNFTVGEPDWPTPQPIVNTAIESLRGGRTRYGAAGGSLPLRTAIVEKLIRDNHLTFTPDQIVCGIGAKEILFHLFLALLNDGDEVILTAPYWVSYADQILAAGAKPVIVPVPSHWPDTMLDVNAVKRAITSKTVGFVLNSPNNPAGYALDDGTLKDLGELLRISRLWVIADEIYEYMAFARPHHSLLSLVPELKERFILVNGMSKSFAMTGWRVGYCAAPKDVAKMVTTLQSQSSTCIPPFIEDAAITALKAGRPLVATDLAKLEPRAAMALKKLQALTLVKTFKPQGAFYLFLDAREFLNKNKQFADTVGLCDHLLTEHLVATVPGEAFGAPGFLRVSYAVSDERLNTGIDRLCRAFAP